jgi:PAS domain S-box-containing protein
MKLNYILIVELLIIALLVSVIGYTSIIKSQEALQKSIGKQSHSLARATLDNIDRSVYHRIDQARAYALDLAQEPELIESNKEFDEMENALEYINEKDKEWTSAPKETVTPFMDKLISSNLAQEIRDEFELKEFYEERYGYPLFGEAFVTNKYGANAAQTQKTSDYNQADEEWWQKAKEEGLYVTDVEYDESAGIYSIDICIRVDDPEGNFLGVLKAVLNIEELINALKEIEEGNGYGIYRDKQYETTHFKFLTKEGKVIYTSEEYYDYEILQSLPEELLLPFYEESNGYFISKDLEPEEGEVLYAHAYSRGYKDFKGLEWILIVEHKTEEIFAPVRRLRNMILTISLIVTTTAVLLGLFISKSISKPIKTLIENVDRISKGDFDVQLEASKIDEINSLIASLNRILASMKLAILRTGATKEELGLGQAIKAKKESEEKYKALFENASEAIFVADTKTRKLIDCNKEAEKLVGYSRKKILSMKADQLHPKDMVKKTMEGFKKQAQGRIKAVESEVLAKNRKRIPVSISTAPVKVGDKSYMFGIFRVTGKKT